MNARARASVFWPGITAHIQDLCDRCRACDHNAPSNPKLLPELTYPFEAFCMNYFHHSGNNYLMLVDRYSGWPEVCKLSGSAGPLVE
jgi:hypothetical protein